MEVMRSAAPPPPRRLVGSGHFLPPLRRRNAAMPPPPPPPTPLYALTPPTAFPCQRQSFPFNLNKTQKGVVLMRLTRERKKCTILLAFALPVRLYIRYPA